VLATSVVSLAAALLATGHAIPCRASPIYPGLIASIVGAQAPPSCLICDDSLLGGLGTATKPLAVYLRSRGLVANDEGSLRNALAAAAAEQHDSDHDGVTDVDELKAGTDPNNAETATVPPPIYGCGGSNVSGAAPTNLPAAAMAVMAAVCLARRRRGRMRSTDDKRRETPRSDMRNSISRG
jgi:hypothetical protein